MALTDKYLNLITSQHRDRPKYIQTVTALLKPLSDTFETAIFFDDEFDIDNAVGNQLDILGVILGRDRYLRTEITDVYFTWDLEGLGWEQGLWKNLFDPDTGITALPDDLYRLVLLTKIIANHWRGDINRLYEMYNTVFGRFGTKVVIQDKQNMTITVGFVGLPDSPVYRALLKQGELFVKPAGVRIDYFIYSTETSEKLFAWDAESDRVAGWDEGHWGTILTVN